MCVVMIVSDTFAKIIANQEEILYYERKKQYYKDGKE